MTVSKRILGLLLLGSAAHGAAAQGAPARVTGVVWDSIGGRPLGAATVQLVSADPAAQFGSSAAADSLGRFTIADVPNGRYRLGFIHPMLDSLGIESPLREVTVSGNRSVTADLAIPSGARLRESICRTGASAARGGDAVLIGIVRDARDGSPAANVGVTGEWLEVTIGSRQYTPHTARITATSGENGWFAMCNVPSPGSMFVTASRGADTTDRIEVQLGEESFARRDLYVGTARTAMSGAAPRAGDTMAVAPRTIHVGDGRLNGTILAASTGRPLPGAMVSVGDGPSARTNERGEFTIGNAPAGTRMLAVRAIGYYPERRSVDVVADVAPVRIALVTLKSVLDTIRVTATRTSGATAAGFEDRRKSTMGRFLTAEDVQKKQPVFVSDLFRMVSGVRITKDSGGFERSLYVRGNMDQWCKPAIWFNGHSMNTLLVSDIDMLARPEDITGIEIYSGPGAPLQFQDGMTGCGSIVIWTKR